MGAKETSLIIEKTKDLNTCQSRSKLHSIVQSTPYNFQPKFQEKENLLKSSSKCELSIDHHIYNKITCKESHVLQPFSNQNAGATTTVQQTLTLLSEVNATIEEQNEITRRTSLIFDHIPTPKPTHGELKTSRDFIKKLCKQSTDDVQIEFSDLFTKFIQTLRILSYPALSVLYEHAGTTCPTGKKHLLDALPSIGTAAAVNVIKDIILKGDIPENTAREWITSMAFIRRPDNDIMEALVQLLHAKEFEPSIIFSITALTHSFCQQNQNCLTTNLATLKIIEFIQNKIIEYYEEDPDKNLDKLIIGLKALSNTGIITEYFTDSLRGIIKNMDVDISIRLAAVETYRRLPCEPNRNYFEKLFWNFDENAEIRIAAYLQVMRCPNYLVMRTIKSSLQHEEVNQVGSYVWSHLNNLLRSSVPNKVEIQSLLSDIDLVKKFSSDVRKYSHNRQGSIFFEEYNVGANYDNNIIFSSSSYIPKSAMLNFSIDLFGESINLLEVYGRAEGFERYFEAMFGPKGPLNSQKLQETFLSKTRFSRSVSDNNVLKNQVDELPNVMDKSLLSDPKVSLGLKIFGNDLNYATFNGEDEIKSALRTLNPIDHLKRLLSGKEISYNKATMFLDSSYVVPSGAGLPISLSAVGTASVNFKLFGSLHAAGFAKTKELDFKADIRPSISLDVTGTMSVDAFYANTGIKLKTSMDTSSAIEGNIKIRGTKLVSVKFSIPRQTSEIFSAKSKLIVMKNNVEHLQSGLSENLITKSICSWPAVDETVGLKLCGDYHFMNVTKINKAPYFILAGPTGFRLFLDKSDPTAKIYLFEYKWTDKNDTSIVSLTFDTPGSTLRRLLSANFTVDRQSKNLTLLFQSSAGTVLARGKYKNTDDEKYFQIALNINDKKHFDASASLIRQDSRHGYIYFPKAYVGVNGDRVLELQGTLKLVSKKGTSQYDVDLKFQTKRLTSKLFGYISKANASIATSLKLDYKFVHTKEQRVMFEFSLANRSPKHIMDIRGTCSLKSTAYPNFNFDAKLKFQRGSGPIECRFDLSSNPLPADHPDAELHKLKFELLFSYKSLPNPILNTIVAVNRQVSGLNLKGQFTYESRGPDVNFLLLVKYAKDKEVSITVFWSHPRTTLEQMEGRINITVPSFTSMILQGKLQEKKSADYIVDLSGTWFSGHSISASGFYQDKSSARSLNYHLKLLLKSLSFQDINTDLQFYRDNDELKIDLKANQNQNDYNFYFKHKIFSPQEIATEVKIKYKSKHYSVTSSVYSGDHRKILVEVHFDQLRDVHFALWEHNKDTYKAAGLEVKWDANRDNNQKLVVSGNFTKIASFNYEGNLLVSYPGRTVLANFNFLLETGRFNTLARLSWGDQQSFAVSFASHYNMGKETYFLINSQIVTPFDNWKKTSLNAGYRHSLNMYHLNGTIFWKHNEHVTIDLYENYFKEESSFECEFRSSLTSTLKNIPTLSAIISHKQNDTKVLSIARLIYTPDQIIDMKSNWQIDRDDNCVNLTGTIVSTTPFNGFSRGYLISKILLTKTKYIRGFADLDVDYKKFIFSLEGFLHKITNSMLEFNVTTPIEKYKDINGRFGISEEHKHIVAKVLYPTGSLGFEVLLDIQSISDFDVIFDLATPIDFIQKVIIVGKLKPDRADFRTGWNSLLLGFNGVWHYVNAIDFEYSYKIYTPIEGFEENGIVTKLIFKEGLDFEVSMKLSGYKLGIAVFAQPKPKPLKELGIKTIDVYINKLDQDLISSETDKQTDDDMDNEDPFSWTGLIKIDAIIYPTMQGALDIDQEGPLYILFGTLLLPDGKAEISDRFLFTDISRMENDLRISTPYESCKSIISEYKLEINPGNKYFLALNLDYQNQSRWIKTGVFARFNLHEAENDVEKNYRAILKIHTPFQTLPQFNADVTYEKDDNIYRTKLLIATNSSEISTTSNIEIDGGFLDASLYLKAKTPTIDIPATSIDLKKDFKINNNLIDINISIPNVFKKQIHSATNWLFKSWTEFYVITQFSSPFKGMDKSYGGIHVSIVDGKSNVWTAVRMHPLEIEINSTLTSNICSVISNINFNGKKFPVLLTTTIIQAGVNQKDFIGNLNLRDKLFKVTGTVYSLGQIPVETHFKLIPEDGSDPLDFEYKLETKENGYIVIGNIQHSQKFAKFEFNMTAIQKFDWQFDLQIDTSNEQYDKFLMHTNVTSTNAGSSIRIEAHTPIITLAHPKLGASVVASGQQRYGRAYFDITDSKGSIDADWIWLFLENIFIKVRGNYENKKYNSTSNLQLFYVNPQKMFNFLKIGGDVNVDTLWSAGSNLTLILPNYQNMSIESHVKLPPPLKETHSILGKISYENNFKSIDYLAKYRTILSEKKYGSWGNISLTDKSHMSGNIELERNTDRITNVLDLNILDNDFNVIYKLRTPKFIDEETFVTKMTYKRSDPYYNVSCEVFYPENQSMGYARVDFREFANMNGTVNVTIPYKNLTYKGADFATETDAYLYKRYIKVFWPNDTAIVDCKYNTLYGHSLFERNSSGVLIAEIPLATRHIAKINFSYEEKHQFSTGRTTVDYNGNKVLEGKYNCLSESRAGFDKDRIHVEVQNKLVPVGADYVHGYEYGAPRDDSDAPTVDEKYLHLYHLENLTKLNVSGEMNVRTTSTGRQFALTAIHSNRSVKLWTDYDVLDQQFKQHSRLELSPSNWIEYDLDLLNQTMDEIFDAQCIQINVSYPRRNFTAQGSYNISDSSVSTDVSLIWDKDNKTVQGGLDWKRVALYREEIQLQIKHPTFQRDVILFGEYEYDKNNMDAQFTVNYSNNPEQTVKVGGQFNDNCNSNLFNYTYNLWAIHDATNLNLNTRGGFYWNPYGYNTGHYTGYKRSYLPLQTAEALARVDFVHNEMEIKKQTGHELTYLKAKYAGQFPIYTANITTTHGMNNASGEFYLNIKENLVQLNYNMTTDGSQSLHMYGLIPDARSSVFNIWRDYEDIRVTDVAYYLKMNHSKLIVSNLQWRPELIQDIQYGVRAGIKQFYNDILEGINDTRQYVRSETNDAIHGIWYDAKPIIQQFLDDLKELTVIENDFNEFKLFLNKFYDANEFYVKDISNITMYMFDELALKSKLQSLPAIVGEIWEVMGDSGMKLKKSILWVIEKIKTYYKNTSDFMHGLFEGDPIDHFADALKTVVEKYDAFIKDMHVAFLRYMENLWTQTYALIVNNWHSQLAAIEPTFLKIVHYLETIVWNTSKEFLDFLYIRKSELIESPYFAKFTNFTHDLDRFYKDITGDNTISSIIKYAKVAWNFLKEKYFSMVPFGKELQDIISEILTELNELKNLPSVQYLIEKCDELFGEIKWFYDYFEVEMRLHRFISLLHMKLTDMSQTALQTENRYRVAKTKFIFEPADGIMHLEQKLPMSWHAFNETPKFQEIPELKMIYNMQNYFTTSRSSFWDFYYDYKPYTEISGWLPPFNAQAMLVGSRYYVTFDRRYYEFQGKCSYLLATDFLDCNFSVVLSYDDDSNTKTHELLLLINNTVIHIDVSNDIVKIDQNETQFLPFQINNDTFIYRQNDILTISSKSGFNLECNMKFDVCLFDVSGWYFGKTAGLWGTINNEPSDDLLTSNKSKAKPEELDQFVNSWTLDNHRENCIKSPNTYIKQLHNKSPLSSNNRRIQILCDEFFVNKLSQFTTCFSRVSKEPFLAMCLNSVTEDEACSSAVAYINLCVSSNTPLRIPDVCVKCNTLNGTILNEGKNLRLEGNDLPQSADIVFIVEAKECNKNLKSRKNFDSVSELLHKELYDLNITNNRYSVVIFGGDGVYNEPRSVVMNSDIFTDFRNIITYLDVVPPGHGNADIFNAIIFATNLLFRPGVSKNFILLPCSECIEANMKLDYAILHQLLLESDVTLHILMNKEFSLQKTRENKIPFGIDRIQAYTKKDIRGLKGDMGLRKQVTLPKSTLGYCMPLALETNGTIFNVRNLEMDKKGSVKKFATVFAKRVASSAKPKHCVECECTAFNTGVSYMECYPCIYPTRTNIDYGFDEYEALSVMQPADEMFSSVEF